MLYLQYSKASRGREWVATIVLGGQGGDFAFGWRGTWKVERETSLGGEGFGAAISVEEAVSERRRRTDLATGSEGEERKGWRVVSEGGNYAWKDE